MEYVSHAEDIASETFVAAFETWPYKGIPENPKAWLYAVAQNKARNYLRREQVFREKVFPELGIGATTIVETEIDLSEQNINDSQLRLLFAVCHPVISAEAQIGLALRFLCGFGIDEIASALLTNRETVNKRLFRAKEKLRNINCSLDLPAANQLMQRLDTVLKTIYLLFNEGYYSESHDIVLREDLCLEAIRLTYLLTENPLTDQPKVNALLALMCFHASRFKARKNAAGEHILYDDQDETLWDRKLIAQGAYFLNRASQGTELSNYHLEAGIAYWHTMKTNSPEKWESMLQIYNHLLQIAYSPIAALNRTYVLAKANGNAAAIAEAEKLRLTDNPYYFTLLGELYMHSDNERAKGYLQQALTLAKTDADKAIICKKLEKLAAY